MASRGPLKFLPDPIAANRDAAGRAEAGNGAQPAAHAPSQQGELAGLSMDYVEGEALANLRLGRPDRTLRSRSSRLIAPDGLDHIGSKAPG
jgi:hypothetical protein